MASANEIKQKRKVALRLRKEGKTIRELSEIFNLSTAKVRTMCGQALRDIEKERKHKIFMEDQAIRDLTCLLPITEQIKELTKTEGANE